MQILYWGRRNRGSFLGLAFPPPPVSCVREREEGLPTQGPTSMLAAVAVAVAVAIPLPLPLHSFSSTNINLRRLLSPLCGDHSTGGTGGREGEVRRLLNCFERHRRTYSTRAVEAASKANSATTPARKGYIRMRDSSSEPTQKR